MRRTRTASVVANTKSELAKRLVGFTTLPFIAALVPLLALPFISRAASLEDWAALNVGLSVGAFAAAVGLVGWNVLGTPLVAMATTVTEQQYLYARSFYLRCAVVAISSTASAVVAVAIAPQSSWPSAASFAVAGALNGIGLSWYAVGVGSPRLVLVYEVIPRTIATVLAVGVVTITEQVVWYGILLCLSVLVGTLAFHLRVYGRWLPPWPGRAQLRLDIGDMKHAWGVESTGSLYANAPVPLSGIVASSAMSAAFASNDKIYRYGMLGVSAAGNALQGWVLETRDAKRRNRNIVAIVIMSMVSVVGWAVLALLGPMLSGWLFGPDKQGDPLAFHFFAIAFVGVAMSTPLIRNVLVPARRDRAVLVITLVAAVGGVAAMLALGFAFGITGVAAGFALSELVALVACIWLTIRVGLHYREPSTRHEEASVDRKENDEA